MLRRGDLGTRIILLLDEFDDGWLLVVTGGTRSAVEDPELLELDFFAKVVEDAFLSRVSRPVFVMVDDGAAMAEDGVNWAEGKDKLLSGIHIISSNIKTDSDRLYSDTQVVFIAVRILG